MAEGEGFEPSIRYNSIPDFESGAFDHSATLPHSGCPKEDRARMIAKELRKEKRRFRRWGSLRRETDAGGKSPVVSEPGFGGKEGFEPTIPSVTCLEFGGSPLEQKPGYAAGVSRMTNTQLIKEGKIKKSNHLQREC